jgi:pimeloyl-ACP methyl ester carboxylesterase
MWRRPLARGAAGGIVVGMAVLGLLLWFRTAPPDSAASAGRSPSVVAATGLALPPPSAGVRPAIADVACWFAVPAGKSARCGILTVPERWGAASSRPLHLRFVVFRAAPGGAGDPVIYLAGGPGAPAQIDAASIGYWWDWIARARWLSQRDLVVFDDRGVGLSEPAMNCPELADAAYRVFAESLRLDEDNGIWSTAAERCRERLTASGIDLADYNTAAIVEDLHSLITLLGYRSWNLLATSYGTRVALRFIERWREGTRAVVLDSVYPPNVAAYVESGPAAAQVFASLFRECDEDKACHAAFPGIARRFEQVVRRAAKTPLRVEIPDPRGGPPLVALLDDGRLIDALFYAFYDWRRIGELPAIIAALAASDTRPLAGLARAALENYVSTSVSHGLFLSVECHDEFPFNRPAAIDRAAAELPLYRHFALSALPLAACPAWPVGQASAEERRATASEVPILLLSGELDPVTPPGWAKLAAKSLPHATRLDFRGVGHGVLAAHACAGVIVGRFLADPARPPLDDCLLAVGPPHFQNVVAGGG